jgi:hypothetical protein
MMAETAFTRALEYASSSLAGLEYLQALTCFCFEPGHVYAFDDITSTKVKIDHNIHGGLRGNVLLQLCRGATNAFILEQQEEQVRFKDGRTKIDLPLLAPEYFLLTTKPELDQIRFKVTAEFFESLDWASTNLLADTYQPVLAGVTVEIGVKQLCLYAFDYAGLLRSTTRIERLTKTDDRETKTIVIPAQCVNRARKIYSVISKNEPVEIRVGSETIRLLFENGTIELSSKLVTDKPVDFMGQLEPFTEDVPRFVIPANFAAALEQCLVLSGGDEGHLSKFVTNVKGIRILCDGVHGKANIWVEANAALPKQEFYFSPQILARKIKVAETMSFSIKDAKAIQFYNPRMRYVVGSVDEPQVEAKVA